MYDNQQVFHAFQGEYHSNEISGWRAQRNCGESRKCTLYTEDRTKHLTVNVKGANGRGSWPYWQCGGGGMQGDVRPSV